MCGDFTFGHYRSASFCVSQTVLSLWQFLTIVTGSTNGILASLAASGMIPMSVEDANRFRAVELWVLAVLFALTGRLSLALNMPDAAQTRWFHYGSIVMIAGAAILNLSQLGTFTTLVGEIFSGGSDCVFAACAQMTRHSADSKPLHCRQQLLRARVCRSVANRARPVDHCSGDSGQPVHVLHHVLAVGEPRAPFQLTPDQERATETGQGAPRLRPRFVALREIGACALRQRQAVHGCTEGCQEQRAVRCADH
jgi:hypothetical protein